MRSGKESREKGTIGVGDVGRKKKIVKIGWGRVAD
jgi:hypothetical protein